MTDHRAEAEKWLAYATEDDLVDVPDNSEIICYALISISHWLGYLAHRLDDRGHEGLPTGLYDQVADYVHTDDQPAPSRPPGTRYETDGTCT
jgi:hypothetical protein